jgi:NO-binding membrane sensor protein with MHYT domain/two-component sensor histidine kinase
MSMSGTHNGWLVLLSMVVATVGAFVSLDLASRVRASSRSRSRLAWQVGGALSIGTAIWTQHFVGMLGFRLPIPVSYDIPTTVVSWLLPVLVSGYGLFTVERDVLDARRLGLGGVLVGSGIVAMHYTGMAAMRMQPPIDYRPAIVLLSVVIALSAATASLWIAFRLKTETILSAFRRKAGSAVLLGSAIYGQHYSGMEAARFDPASLSMAGPLNFDPLQLAAIVAASSLTLLLLTMLLSALDTYRADLAVRTARELERRVAERTAQLQELSRRLVDLQESERRELARELHDRIGQNLTALAINLDLLQMQPASRTDPVIRERLEDSGHVLQSTFATIENVLADLRPPLLEESGLVPALSLYSSRFAARTSIAVAVQGDENLRLPPRVELAFFRVAQEALNNTARHARAAHVLIDLHDVEGNVALVIADDGVGFDPPAAGRGLGLATMRERSQAVGAFFEIDAQPGSGTVITVTTAPAP